ncbi:MAG: hypothetical protein WAL38_10785 [Solirubrobacteraceae bacterium]
MVGLIVESVAGDAQYAEVVLLEGGVADAVVFESARIVVVRLPVELDDELPLGRSGPENHPV